MKKKLVIKKLPPGFDIEKFKKEWDDYIYVPSRLHEADEVGHIKLNGIHADHIIIDDMKGDKK